MTDWSAGGGAGGSGYGGQNPSGGQPGPFGPQDWPGGWGNPGSPPPPPAQPPPAYGATPPPVLYAAPPPQPPRRTNKALIIGLSAAAVVVVVVIVAVVVAVSGGSGAAGTPQDAVKGYLEALARGDASAALSFGKDQPGTTELLTDDILSQQIAKQPITDIRILDGESAAPVGGYARVHVSAKFGATVSDTTLMVQKGEDGWKLDRAAIKVDTHVLSGANRAMATLTIFGKPTSSPVYVFPGYLEVASSNPNLTVTAKTPLLDGLALADSGMSLSDAQFALSGEAEKSIMGELAEALNKCTQSNLLSPPGCPMRMKDVSLVEGTAKWGPFNDLGQVRLMFNQYDMSAKLIGTVKGPFSAQTRFGGMRDGNVTGLINGNADLSSNPPTVTYQ